MTRYKGIASGDMPVGGGAYILEHGFGHEIFNFDPFRGSVYGYGQPPGRKDQWEQAKINLDRLGASATDDSVSGVLAVWVATAPSGGAYVVGWYNNATVFRKWQASPAGSSRTCKNVDCGYYVTANAKDAVLIAPDQRVFSVPQHGRGNFGQSNIWYADDPRVHRKFREHLFRYIKTRQPPRPANEEPPRGEVDPLLRQKIEKIAVEVTTQHFTELGYSVNSVEKDNVGWDLNAVLARRGLKLEVKGLSGNQCVVELTPNEYKSLQSNNDSYRICIVSNALKEPRLEIFAYSVDGARWESAEGRVLNLQELIAVRCTAE